MKYTYDDIIINPNDPRLENAIGKKVFYSDIPSFVLESAKNCGIEGTLADIDKASAFPFEVEKHYVEGATWCACIILKKDRTKKKVEE